MYNMRVTVLSVDVSAAQMEIQSSRRVVTTIRAIARDLRAAAIRSFLSQEKGFSRRPWFYDRSFRIVQTGPMFRVQNVDPTATMVEYGSHAAGVTPVLGYAPFRHGIDAITRDWNSTVRLP